MIKTHYDNLQVTRKASPEVIKGAYKFLTQKWHPDKNPDNRAEAERILKVINRAYDVLSDPQLRKEHDEWIAEQENEEAASHSRFSQTQPKPETEFESSSEKNISSNIALWNPNVAANWSLLFSPIFGAWVHAKNWTTLGDKNKADNSMAWVYGGIAFVVLSLFIPDGLSRALGLGYLFGWYFSVARPQVKFVKEKLGDTYQKKSWWIPFKNVGMVFILIFFVAFLFS